MADELMTDADLAKRLKVPESWVVDAAKSGRIPHTFIGKHRRYTERHYQQIVAAGERQPRRGRRSQASTTRAEAA